MQCSSSCDPASRFYAKLKPCFVIGIVRMRSPLAVNTARNRSETCLLIKLIDYYLTVGKTRYEFQLSAQGRDEFAQGADVNVVLMLHF